MARKVDSRESRLRLVAPAIAFTEKSRLQPSLSMFFYLWMMIQLKDVRASNEEHINGAISQWNREQETPVGRKVSCTTFSF